jgi:hypothetical protein
LNFFLVVRKVHFYYRTKIYYGNKYKYSFSLITLSQEDFRAYFFKYIEFMSTHIDTILNISILVSLIFIYFHVPKAIRLFITGNVNKIEVVEDLDVEVKNSINDKEKFFEK